MDSNKLETNQDIGSSVKILYENYKKLEEENSKLKIENKLLQSQIELRPYTNEFYSKKSNIEQFMDYIQFDYN